VQGQEENEGMSIRLFYDRWPQYNRRLVDVVGALTVEQLALRATADQWPIWATVGHVAAVRVYWLCTVLKEPGAERTPWPSPTDDGWEDDLAHPRSASELAGALDSTFGVVDDVLDRWTPDMLDTPFERTHGDRRQIHTRTSVLQRLLSHEAYHGGEISQTLGVHGFEPVYIWAPYA
jgi:uncharacterized damage-inducible protein DinB